MTTTIIEIDAMEDKTIIKEIEAKRGAKMSGKDQEVLDLLHLHPLRKVVLVF